MEFARELAFDRVVVEPERVAQIRDGPAIDADARVDLFAAILAGISERERAVGFDLAVTLAHDAARDHT